MLPCALVLVSEAVILDATVGVVLGIYCLEEERYKYMVKMRRRCVGSSGWRELTLPPVYTWRGRVN